MLRICSSSLLQHLDSKLDHSITVTVDMKEIIMSGIKKINMAGLPLRSVFWKHSGFLIDQAATKAPRVETMKFPMVRAKWTDKKRALPVGWLVQSKFVVPESLESEAGPNVHGVNTEVITQEGWKKIVKKAPLNPKATTKMRME